MKMSNIELEQVTKKHFTSQLATNYDESKQLINLGLLPETADMRYESWNSRTDGLGTWSKPSLCIGFNPQSSSFIGACTNKIDIPAWSLSRLLSLIPRCLKIDGICGENEEVTESVFLELSVIPTMQFQCTYISHKSSKHYEVVGGTDILAVIRMIEKLINDDQIDKSLFDI